MSTRRLTRSAAKPVVPSSSSGVNGPPAPSTAAPKKGSKKQTVPSSSPLDNVSDNTTLTNKGSKKKKKATQEPLLLVDEPAISTSPSTTLMEVSSIAVDTSTDAMDIDEEQDCEATAPALVKKPTASNKKLTASNKKSAASAEESAASTKPTASNKKPAASAKPATSTKPTASNKKPATSAKPATSTKSAASTQKSAASAKPAASNKKPAASAEESAASTKKSTTPAGGAKGGSPAGPDLLSVHLKKTPPIMSRQTSTTSTKSKSAASKPSPTTSLPASASYTGVSSPNTGAMNADEIASLKETICHLAAELDKAKKAEAARPKKEETDLIPRPTGPHNLQDAMGLIDNSMLYNSCRASVNTAMVEVRFPTNKDWRKQDRQLVLRVMESAREIQPHLKRYEQNWAIEEIMASIGKNKRNYQAKQRRKNTANKKGEQCNSDEGLAEGSDEKDGGHDVENSGDNDENAEKGNNDGGAEEDEGEIGVANEESQDISGDEEELGGEYGTSSESESKDEEMVDGADDGVDDGVDEEAQKVNRRSLKRRHEDDDKNGGKNRGGKRRKS